MSQDSTGSLIIPPRLVATGSPAGDALENENTNILADGALCYVSGGPGQGMWQLSKSSTASPDGTTIVAPIAGPGRWLLVSAAGGGGGPGAILRQAVLIEDLDAPADIAQGTSRTTGAVSLGNFDPTKLYQATLEFHMRLGATFSATGVVSYTFEVSADNVAWDTWAVRESVFVATEEDSPARSPADVFWQLNPALGGSLPEVPAGGDPLYCRAIIALSASGGGENGSVVVNSSPAFALTLRELAP
jgi:hypothetical protein